MKVDLDTDETIVVVVDGTCEFKVWGERNEEGTMVMKYMRYNALVGTGESEDEHGN